MNIVNSNSKYLSTPSIDTLIKQTESINDNIITIFNRYRYIINWKLIIYLYTQSIKNTFAYQTCKSEFFFFLYNKSSTALILHLKCHPFINNVRKCFSNIINQHFLYTIVYSSQIEIGLLSTQKTTYFFKQISLCI